MKKFLQLVLVASLAVFILAACGNDSEANAKGNNNSETENNSSENDNNNSEADSTGDKLQVVASFTILSDIVREIGGDKVEVHNLVPTGTDPHEYEPLPEDSKKATDADILFYNGMNLEGGEEGWFFKMMESVGQDEENAYSLTERVEPMYLTDEQTREEEVNPHTFIDPTVGIKMAEDMRDAFVKVDPDNTDYYEENAEVYMERLNDLDQQYADKIGELPEDNKTLVTSECAYQYMLDTYGMKEGCIWKIDTEENGSPDQITSLIKFIEENNVETVFVESNVDERPMETVIAELDGVKIFEKDIYSDEIGMPGEEIDTYVKYLQYNIDIIAEGLGA